MTVLSLFPPAESSGWGIGKGTAFCVLELTASIGITAIKKRNATAKKTFDFIWSAAACLLIAYGNGKHSAFASFFASSVFCILPSKKVRRLLSSYSPTNINIPSPLLTVYAENGCALFGQTFFDRKRVRFFFVFTIEPLLQYFWRHRQTAIWMKMHDGTNHLAKCILLCR